MWLYRQLVIGNLRHHQFLTPNTQGESKNRSYSSSQKRIRRAIISFKPKIVFYMYFLNVTSTVWHPSRFVIPPLMDTLTFFCSSVSRARCQSQNGRKICSQQLHSIFSIRIFQRIGCCRVRDRFILRMIFFFPENSCGLHIIMAISSSTLVLRWLRNSCGHQRIFGG